MNTAGGRLNSSDLLYLRGAHRLDPWVPAIGVEMQDTVSDDALRTALGKALDAHPRFAARIHGRHWLPEATAQDVPILRAVSQDLPVAGTSTDLERNDRFEQQVIDESFAHDCASPIRIGVDEKRLTVAWRHAVSDATGGVAFVSSLLAALCADGCDDTRAATRIGTERRGMWASAARPAVVAEVARRIREQRASVTFPLVAAPGSESCTRVWTLDSEEAAAFAAVRKSAGIGFSAMLVFAAAATCFDLLCSDIRDRNRIGVGIPVNLRPHAAPQRRAAEGSTPGSTPESNWLPIGNFVGNASVMFDRMPTHAELATRLHTAIGAPAYASLWAGAARSLFPEWLVSRRARPDDPGSLGMSTTIFVNNLGVADAPEFPGARRAWFGAPTAVDGPSVSAFSIGRTTSIAVRVREHQGGGALAAGLMEQIKSRLLA